MAVTDADRDDGGRPSVVTLALERFRLAADAEREQRARELDDLRFVDFGEQWPDDVKASRQGYQPGGGLPAVPPRPCLTINRLLQPVEQVANQARQARLSLTFAPKGDGASQDTAEAFEDIARAIQVDSRAHLARQWAFQRAVKAGRGYYRILTEYANDGDFDQDIVYKRILNQSAVFFDPATTEPDCSDAEWCLVTEDMPIEKFRRLYPESKLSGADTGELTAYGDDQPDWVRDTEAGRLVRVAEYWFVEYEAVTVRNYQMPDGTERAFADADVPEGAVPVVDETGAVMSRELRRRKVQWTKITAADVLEPVQEWIGRHIPIIPVIGREANVNGERRWEGIVGPAKDPQRTYNYQASAEVEAVALAPRAPFVGYSETIEPYMAWWAQANVRNFPILPVAFVRDGSGAPLPPPQRNTVEPAIQAIVLAKQGADGDIKATTGIFDPSLGNLSTGERSGRAIERLQAVAEQGSGAYLDNLANMSMLYEGKILRDLIPRVYHRPGRLVPAMGADDQRRQILLGRDYVQQGGQPQPVAPGTPGAKRVDLGVGQYAVAITVGKAYTTRREEGVSQMGALAEAAPALVPTFADLWVGNMDFPGARQIADRLKKTLPPELQDQGDTPDPRQLQQQLQQAGQMVEMLTKELQAKTQAIETESVKAQSRLEETQLQEQAENERVLARIAADERKAAMDNLVRLAVAEIAATKDAAAVQGQERTAAMAHLVKLAVADIAAAKDEAAVAESAATLAAPVGPSMPDPMPSAAGPSGLMPDAGAPGAAGMPMGAPAGPVDVSSLEGAGALPMGPAE